MEVKKKVKRIFYSDKVFEINTLLLSVTNQKYRTARMLCRDNPNHNALL